jgi:N-methylhydantoinase B
MAVGGVDLDGEHWLAQGGEVMLGSFGGSPTSDGVDFSGHWWMPGGIGPNVEDLEATNPVLYIYRRPLQAGLDGAGRHRGGLGLIYAMCLRAGEASVLFATGEAFPGGAGVMGSAPGSRARAVVVHGSDTFARLQRSQIPSSSEELSGDRHELPWKTMEYRLQVGDVLEGVFPNIAGYGDPIRRSPAAVLADVTARILDPTSARRVYGVVVTGDHIDEAATSEDRLSIRRDRLSGKEPAERVAPPEGAQPVGEMLHVVDGRWWCNGADLGPSDANYKDATVTLETPIQAIGKEYASPFPAVADRVVFREYVCPVTGYRIDTELSLRDQPPLHDIRISP